MHRIMGSTCKSYMIKYRTLMESRCIELYDQNAYVMNIYKVMGSRCTVCDQDGQLYDQGA